MGTTEVKGLRLKKLSRRQLILHALLTLMRAGVGAWVGWEVGGEFADGLEWDVRAPQWIGAVLLALGIPLFFHYGERTGQDWSIESQLPTSLRPHWRRYVVTPSIGLIIGVLAFAAGITAVSLTSLYLTESLLPTWLDALVALLAGLATSATMFAFPSLRKFSIWCAVAALLLWILFTLP